MTTQWSSPDLQNLVDLFYDSPSDLANFSEVKERQIKQPYQDLLNHSNHMTVTVQQFHNSLVTVEVVKEQKTRTHYSRKILLRRQSDDQVVQFGIVRINRMQIPTDVMKLIEGKTKPLGRILIENNILRNVRLLSLWKIVPGDDLIKQFGQGPFDQCYGRTAILYLDGLPVVELLEIVRP